MRKVVLDTNCLLMSIPKISPYRRIWDDFLGGKIVLCVTPYYKLHLIQADEDDNKFVDCAFVSGASCIVSNDAHFNILKEINFPKIFVLRIKEFLDLLMQDKD